MEWNGSEGEEKGGGEGEDIHQTLVKERRDYSSHPASFDG